MTGVRITEPKVKASSLDDLRRRLNERGDKELLFEDLDLRGWSFARAGFVGVNAIRVDLTGPTLREADLSNADMRDARISDVDLRSARLDDADMHKASSNRVKLHGVPLVATRRVDTIRADAIDNGPKGEPQVLRDDEARAWLVKAASAG